MRRPLSPALATFTVSGDVNPFDPSTWDNSTIGYIGQTSAGTLTVNGSSNLLSGTCFLGYNPGVTGIVTISGASSTWNDSYNLYIGYIGAGSLSIVNGGNVASSSSSGSYGAYIGFGGGSSGTATVNGAGSTWNTGSYGLSVGYYGSGRLAITNGGTSPATATPKATSATIAACRARLPSTAPLDVDQRLRPLCRQRR